jgi:peptidoglycan hydrolase CwlO-like protein
MDNEEQKQLSDIHDEVKGSHAQLGRIDERTRNIKENIEGINEKAEENRRDIDELESKVKRNTTIVGGFSAGGMAVVIWLSDKITRLV